MSLSSFLNRNWLGVAGLLVGVFGIALSIYFYLESQVRREPILLFDTTRTEIVSSKHTLTAPIRVIKPDGTQVKSDLIAVRFYFWNQGRLSIRRENILQPIRLTLASPGAQILDVRFLRASRDITKLTISMVDGEPRRSVTVDFQILDYLDGGTGLIIYEGDPKAEFQVTGVIEGVGQIETNATISPRRLWVEYIRGLTGLVGLVISFLAVALFVKLPDWLRRAPIPKPLQSVGALLGKIFLFLTLALSIAGVFWILILDPFLKARTRFQENIAHRVPAHILPRK